MSPTDFFVMFAEEQSLVGSRTVHVIDLTGDDFLSDSPDPEPPAKKARGTRVKPDDIILLEDDASTNVSAASDVEVAVDVPSEPPTGASRKKESSTAAPAMAQLSPSPYSFTRPQCPICDDICKQVCQCR